jgi:7,8-dihydropterin-6-yl-methyl-4-(beta-D-ribofuranosyl)aminobenzene 5'-phosphate synthase
MESSLGLTVLVDNTTFLDHDFYGEAGLSFLLETAGKNILFDTGLSGLFLANAGKMGIGLDDLAIVVLSHGHIDHTGGLAPLARHLALKVPDGRRGNRVPDLFAHPRCFLPKENDRRKNGSPMDEEEARQYFRLCLSKEPVRITGDLVFLGEIPRTFAFEKTGTGKRRIHFPDGRTEPDQLLDDSALAFCSTEGLVIITGCSHAGICNITEHARQVCGENRVAGIIGGLHLMRPRPWRLKMTGEYLRALQLPAIHACHCTSLAAKIALNQYCPVKEVGVGIKLDW